jgi:hypothetical protein
VVADSEKALASHSDQGITIQNNLDCVERVISCVDKSSGQCVSRPVGLFYQVFSDIPSTRRDVFFKRIIMQWEILLTSSAVPGRDCNPEGLFQSPKRQAGNGFVLVVLHRGQLASSKRVASCWEDEDACVQGNSSKYEREWQ